GADPLGDLAPQLVALAVDEEERAAIRLHDAGRGQDDELEQAIEIALGDQRLRDVEDAAELPHPFLEPVHGGDSTIRSLARGRPTPPPVRLPARRSARITSGSAYTPRTRRASSNRSGGA